LFVALLKLHREGGGLQLVRFARLPTHDLDPFAD